MTKAVDIFDDANEVKSKFVGWGAVGDWFKGTYTGSKQTKSTLPGRESELQTIYEFKSKGGSFHTLDEKKNPVKPAVVVNADEFWSVGGRASIDNAMRNIKVGQIVGFKFTEEKAAKTKGFNALKIIKTYAGKMDPEYAGEEKGFNEV